MSPLCACVEQPENVFSASAWRRGGGEALITTEKSATDGSRVYAGEVYLGIECQRERIISRFCTLASRVVSGGNIRYETRHV